MCAGLYFAGLYATVAIGVRQHDRNLVVHEVQYKMRYENLKALVLISLAVGVVACGANPPDNPASGDSNRPGDAVGDSDFLVGDGSGAQGIQVIFVIVMENHAESQIYGNTTSAPYINNTLLPMGGRASLYEDDLPLLLSEPHYIWMEAGTNQFSDYIFLTDSDPSGLNSTTSTEHLVTQMKSAGNDSWLSYQEDISTSTGDCPINSSGHYAAKHDPFVFFSDVAGDPPSKTNTYCAAHHKSYSSLAGDLASDSVATYNYIIPNLCHDMHGQTGCPGNSDPIRQGDDWLAANMAALIDYANSHDGAIWIAWDEPQSSGNLPFIVLGPHAKAGYVSDVRYSHSSYLKSLEEILGVPVLSNVSSANDFVDFFETGYFRPN